MRHKAGITVGFGIATDDQYGLVKGGNVPGQTSGTAIAAGYVGEVIEATITTTALSTLADITGASITLTPGVWMIHSSLSVDGSTTTTADNSCECITLITDSSNNQIYGTRKASYVRTHTTGKANIMEACHAVNLVVNLTATTTYKCRGLRNSGSAGNCVNSGSYESTFFAVRIA